MLMTTLKQNTKVNKPLFDLRNTLSYFSNLQYYFFSFVKKLYSDFSFLGVDTLIQITRFISVKELWSLPLEQIFIPNKLLLYNKVSIYPPVFLNTAFLPGKTRTFFQSFILCNIAVLFLLGSFEPKVFLETFFSSAFFLEVQGEESQFHRLNFGFFLIFSSLIFSIGAFGIAFNRKNIILLLISVEIMFLGINLVFISGYIFLQLELGLVYALISLSISAAEAAIGFGLITSSFRNLPDISIQEFSKLKG